MQARKKGGPLPRSATHLGGGIVRAEVRHSVGDCPLCLSPSSASGANPSATTVLLCSAGFVWRLRSWPLRSCSAGTRILNKKGLKGPVVAGGGAPPGLSVRAGAPRRRRPAAGPPGLRARRCRRGRPRPWAALQRDAGGRQGKHGPQRGARNSADGALLRPGRGGASLRRRS